MLGEEDGAEEGRVIIRAMMERMVLVGLVMTARM